MLIDEKLILIDGAFKDKDSLFKELSKIAFQVGKINSEEVFINAVKEREACISTFVGKGMAIPHGKSSTVVEAMIAFAKLKEPIMWGEEEMVDMVFMLGVPDNQANNYYLQILAKLSRKLMDEEFTDNLRASKTVQEIFDCLTNSL